MHQKKSEAQIGKESSGVSSDFNPSPPLLFFPQIVSHHLHHHHRDPSYSAAPFKRPLLTHRFSPTPSSPSSSPILLLKSYLSRSLRRSPLFLLLLPLSYFLLSHPTRPFLVDFLSAFAFSAALLFSLNLALHRLPSFRLFLARSFPSPSRTPLPVFWSIGSRRKSDKRGSSGCWVQVYTNGDVYEGEFHKGKCSGSGVYYYYMSGRYEGDWVDGKYDGYGVETWARGSRFRGQYRQGLRHGYGVYRFYTGDMFSGEWSSGQSHGCGVHTCEDGSRYVGEFKWGVKHGLGHYHFRNGDVYAGEYFADKMHGFGVYGFANGHRYEGAWHEGRRQGLGMYTFRNGETQSGHWQNGILDIPSTQNSNCPVSPVAVNHSKVLNAVQEARRAAKKAYDVDKVDERVNRAVAAANRAANAARVVAVRAAKKKSKNMDNFPIPLV
uniref:Phosphatidylinositol 4-phosphate 5-kinase 1 n=1 Tax=Noccaea caerulescens TaxID=107243 RepID=A0A1J3F5I3_NOCCA